MRAISGWDGLPTGFVGVIRDVTDERRSHQHAAAEQAVMRLLAAADGIEEAGSGLLEILGSELGLGRRGAVADGRRRAPAPRRRAGPRRAPGSSTSSPPASGSPSRSATGSRARPGCRACRCGTPRSAESDGFIRYEAAVADGVSSTVALPLRAGGAPAGVVVLVSRTPRDPEAGLDRLLEAIGGQVTQFLHRREAEARVAAQAADLRTLSGVAHELAAQDDMFAARMTLCRAVRDVTGSASVTLWEPVHGRLGARGLGRGRRRRARHAGRARRPRAHRRLVPVGRALLRGRRRPPTRSWPTGTTSPAPRPRRGSRSCTATAPSACWPSAGRRFARRCRERDEELLRLLAAEAAITIHRTDLLARLQSTARTDPLTGLPNRRVWDEDLEREIARARRHGGSLCLAMLDLDRFKAFNDEYGHQAGDQLLAASAAAWRPALRATDTLARYGGEEFAVLLPHSDEEAALIVVERLLEVVPLGQTASAGVAVWDGTETAEALLARADAALYRAKGAGRAQACVA